MCRGERLSVLLHQLQAEMFGHRSEIPIAGQERMAVGDAEGADDQVDGLAYGDAASTQAPVVHRTLDGEIRIEHGRYVEPPQRALDPMRLALARNALQNLQQHHVADQQRLLPHQRPQSLDLAGHSGGGLRDTTRIAASSSEMWRDIFLWNRDNLVSFIDRYERALGDLKQLIKDGDAAGIEKAIERAKAEREKLNAHSPVST